MHANWGASPDLDAILAQTDLIDDFLRDKMGILGSARSVEAKHAILWAIQHLIPIRQFPAGKINTIFYENLCLQPEVEIPRIFQTIGLKYRESAIKNAHIPSRTVLRTSAIRTGADRVTRWKQELSQTQIGDILSVVRDFGLDYIYGDSYAPLVETL
jgi:hypothetical protein